MTIWKLIYFWHDAETKNGFIEYFADKESLNNRVLFAFLSVKDLGSDNFDKTY